MMSKEKETLITDLRINTVDGFFYITRKLQAEIRELLTQPEQEPTTRHALDSYWNQEAYQRGYAEAKLKLKREPLSDEEIHAYLSLMEPPFLWDEGFCNGIEWAEKAHGIGGK